jgi:hypothetical protein
MKKDNRMKLIIITVGVVIVVMGAVSSVFILTDGKADNILATGDLSGQQAAQEVPLDIYLPIIDKNKESPSPSPSPSPTQTQTPVPPPSGSLFANSHVIPQFDNIPKSAVDAATARRVLFYHQSTGAVIVSNGLDCLSGKNWDPNYFPPECIIFSEDPGSGYYDWDTHWDWPMWPEPQADALAKMSQFVSLVPEYQQNYDIIGMKFCYVDGYNEDFNDYRTKIENLENTYPSKAFILSTSALWADPGGSCPSCENIKLFNDQVRAYAAANHKPLYDIASIESNGGACQVAGYEGLCSEYYEGGGGHPNYVGAIRLAKGFWWLIARLSGWNP